MNAQPAKGPGPRVQNAREEPDMTRDDRIKKMELQMVMNGRVFAPDILTKFSMQHWLMLLPFKNKVTYLNHLPHICMNLRCASFITKCSYLKRG